MRSLICLVSMLCGCIYANTPEEGYLSSTNASYDGNALILNGHVILDHGLGKMTADEAALERQESGKDFPFSLIHLKKEVLLSLKNNAKLTCDYADLDFTSLKGFLTAPEKGKVSYLDTLKKKSGDATPLRLMSKTIELTLLRNEKADKKADYDIDTVLAKEDVIIDYDNAFVLRADHALYRKASAVQSSTSKDFQGTITAYPKDDKSRCHLTHEGDVIESDSVDIDLIHSLVTMHRPKGLLASPLVPNVQKGEIHFTSDHLTWDHLKQVLVLKGHAFVHEDHLGTITAEDQIAIEQSQLKGKNIVKTIQTKGATKLHYQDPASPEYHKLMCFGNMIIDREHLNAVLTSPQKDGLLSRSEQIYYEQLKMGSYADKAFVEYSIEENTFQPVSLTLKGHVCLFSHDPKEPVRCGLADRLTYSPTTKTLILAANPGQRVLFWDEEQSLRMSAQEVHLTEDPVTQKTMIKGIGNVRFTLSAEENEVLQKFFPQFLQPAQVP